MRFGLFGFTIWKSPAGMISEGPLWCCFHDSWLYLSPGFFGLLWTMLTEFKQDKHLAG